MRRLIWVSGLVAASLVMAGPCFAADDDQAGTSKPLVIQGQLAMAICASIWTTKTHDELDAMERTFTDDLDNQDRFLPSYFRSYPDELKAAEDGVAVARKAWEDSLAKAVADAARTGSVVSGGNAPDTANLRTAEAGLEAIKTKYSRRRAWFVGLPALQVTMEHCIGDQRIYLGPNPTGPTKPSLPADKTDGIVVSGTWTGSCLNQAGTRTPHSGSVTLRFSPNGAKEHEGVVAGTFDFDGATATLKGIWYKNSNTWKATGTLRGKPWEFTGQVADKTGPFISAAEVTGFLDNGASCRGEYNGGQGN